MRAELVYCVLLIATGVLTGSRSSANESDIESIHRIVSNLRTRYSSIQQIDFVFVLDRSSKVSQSDWLTLINFIKVRFSYFIW